MSRLILILLAALPALAQPTVTGVVIDGVTHSTAHVTATSSASVTPANFRAMYGSTGDTNCPYTGPSTYGCTFNPGAVECTATSQPPFCPNYQIAAAISGLGPSLTYHLIMQASLDGITWGSSSDTPFTTSALPGTHPAFPVATTTFDASVPTSFAVTLTVGVSPGCSTYQACLNTASAEQYTAGGAIAIIVAAGSTINAGAGIIQPPIDVNAISFAPANVNTGTNTITVTTPTYGNLAANQGIRFAVGGGGPTSNCSSQCLPGWNASLSFPQSTPNTLVQGGFYYVVNPTGGCSTSGMSCTFQVSATPSGSPLTFANAGVGTNYVTLFPPALRNAIVTRTSTPDSQFAPPGTRAMGSVWASKMAKLEITGGLWTQSGEANGPLVFQTNVGSHDYYFVGLEITHTDAASLANSSTDPRPTRDLVFLNVSDAPYQIVFDRDYIHGLGAPNRLLGFAEGGFDGANIALTNSDMEDITYWRPWLSSGSPGVQGFAQTISGNQVSAANGTYYAGPFVGASGFCTSSGFSSTVTAGSSAAKSITAATNANPGVLTASGIPSVVSGNSYGATISGFTGNWTPFNGNVTVTFTSTSTFTVSVSGVPVNSTTFGAVTGTPVITIFINAVVYFTSNCTPTAMYPFSITATCTGTGSDGTNTHGCAIINAASSADPDFPRDPSGSYGCAPLYTITLSNGVPSSSGGVGGSIYFTEGSNTIIAGWGPGPFQFLNNYVQAPGLSWHFDDSATGIAHPANYDIERNNFDLTGFRTGTDTTYDYEERNGVEWKNGQQAKVIGNTCLNYFAGVAADGACFTMTPRGAGTISDFEIAYNTATNGVYFLSMIGGLMTGGQQMPYPMLRMYVHDNFVNQSNGWTQFSWPNRSLGGDYPFYFGNAMEDTRVAHNTIYNTLGPDPSWLHWLGQPVEGTLIQNNILWVNNDANSYGMNSEGVTGNTPNCNGLIGSAYATSCLIAGSNPFFKTGSNLLVPYNSSTNPPTGTVSASTTVTTWNGSGFSAPTTQTGMMAGSNAGANFIRGDTTLPARLSNIGFTNVGAGVFSLTSGSPYHNAGTDGLDIGVNWSALQNAQGVVQAFAVPTPGSTSATATATTPDSQGCSVDVTTNAFSTFTRFAQAGGSTSQSTALTALTAATTYQARLNCAVFQPIVSFTTASGSTGVPVAGPGVAGPGVQ